MVAGVVIAAVGVDALRHVEHPSERPLVALPLIFGTHQMVEAVVWWGVAGHVTDRVTGGFTWLYLAVAFGLLPWFVPWAVRRMEPDPTRRRIMATLSILGGLVSVHLMSAVAQGPVAVTDGGHYLAYQVPLSFGMLTAVLYVVATCGSLLLSSDRYAVQFGAINLAVVIVLAVLLLSGVISLWCVWAAVTSAVIALHLRRTDPHRHRFPIAPAMS